MARALLCGARGVLAGEVAMTEEAEDPLVIVCQGPPRCLLEGNDAVKAQEAGCVWCKRIIVHRDGTETVQEPGTA